MAFLGMNIDQASEQVERLQTGEQRLEDLAGRLGATVSSSADFWRGPDAESFRATWESTSHALRSAGQELASRGAELTQHQQEQTTASESDGRSGGPGAGGPGADGPSATDPVDKTNLSGEKPYYGEVDPEVAERWEKMDKDEREQVAQAMLDEEMERYGLDPVTIDFAPIDANGRWSFNSEDGHAVEISGDDLSDPRLLHTIAHEARHAAQWEAAQDTEAGALDWLPFVDSTEGDYERLEEEHGFTRDEIDSWRDHWDTPEEDRGPYLDQSVERDARDAGAEFSDGLTMEDLDRYQEAAEDS